MADDNKPVIPGGDLPVPEASPFFETGSPASEPAAPAEPVLAPEPAAPAEPAPALQPAAPLEPGLAPEPAAPAEPALAPEPAAPADVLGSTHPHAPLPGEYADPAVAQPTQLITPVGAPVAPVAAEPFPPFDPQAAQLTQVVPAVGPAPVAPQPIAGAPVPQLAQPRLPMVVAGSRVVVIVSRGASDVPPTVVTGMPHVLGMSQGEALSQLQQVGLSAQVFNDYSDLPRGEVVGQLPPYGQSAPAGSEAVLLVSAGPAPASSLLVLLPDVVGLTEADALARIQQAGLSPQIVRDFSPNVPLGRVIEQLPSGHAIAEEPKKAPSLWWLWLLLVVAVAFAVSGGAYYWLNRTAVVPNVVGLSQSKAEQAVKAAGFKLGSVSTTITASAAMVGHVTSQTPAPNAQAKLIDQVDLVVGMSSGAVTIPDVTNKPEAEARSVLTSVGLAVATTTTPNALLATGTVISQTPAAGQSVPSSTVVTLTVSSGGAGGGSSTIPVTTPVIPPTTPGVQNVVVPNVVGKSQSSAQTALSKVGLLYSVTAVQNASVSKGRVITQGQASGQQIPKGTIVALTVSSGPPPAAPPSMPALTEKDMHVGTASGKLTKLGLKVKVLYVRGLALSAGYVIAQCPLAGTGVAKGTTVLVVASKSAASSAEATSAVPDVAATYTTTKNNLISGGFGQPQRFNWAGGTSGTLLAQYPPGGTAIVKGSNGVVLVVAK